MSYSVSDPIEPHVYCSECFLFGHSIQDDIFCCDAISNGVGVCGWPISARAVCIDVAFWNFSNNPPNYSSVSDAIAFLIMLHYTCAGPFSVGIAVIGVCS